jgi:phosphoglycolate phosphatase
MKHMDTIIWDWNGTLLDDVDLCLASINRLLGDRGHPVLSKDTYRDIFTFPVRDYYVRAGFDLRAEPFDGVAIEFIGLYRQGLPRCGVFPGARMALEYFRAKGYRQYLISAMEHRFLMESLRHCGLDQYFDDFSGIQDHFADGKTAMADAFIRDRGIDPGRSLFIGDTLHDQEVAGHLGMPCLLVANGHQSEVRLLHAGCEVVTDLREVVSRVGGGEYGQVPVNHTKNKIYEDR